MLQRTAESKLHIPWNLVIWFHDFSGAGVECRSYLPLYATGHIDST